MTTSATLQALSAASVSADLLRTLKDLKNSVIGNTWKKVEHAGDDALLRFLNELLVCPAPDDTQGAAIVTEAAVILGALGSAGTLTLRPLLAEGVPARLLACVRDTSPNHPAAGKILPALLRALRNILSSTADAVWGHMGGVGGEQKVVGTGLVGDDVLRPARVRGKHRAAAWRTDATQALGLVFEPQNRAALLALIEWDRDPSVLLPLYQLLSHLAPLPSHRAALALDPGPNADPTQQGGPFLITHLLDSVMDWWSPGNRPNPKLLQAALDLIGALAKDQPAIARLIREWTFDNDGEADDVPDVIGVLVELLASGPPGVRIAAAGCLTNVLKSDKGFHARDRINLSHINLNLLATVVKLLRTETVTERVKLCFVLAALVSEDERLQKAAAEQGCPSLLLSMLVEVDADEARGEIGHDTASISREGTLLALAALSFQFEATRSLIADATPPVLPLVCKALSHPSYGVRASATQLARALSRTVAILKTSLVDSGIGEEVVALLRREVARRRAEDEDGPVDTLVDMTAEEEIGDRAWTVEVAATATICNLVTDFSPLKATLLSNGGLELIVELASSPHEPLAINALWALKNLAYHASESLKAQLMAALGWDTLRRFMSAPTSPGLRTQALNILQNLTDDEPPSELSRIVDLLGAELVLDVLEETSRADDPDLRSPALYVLGHLALGNERVRSLITGRRAILGALVDALNVRIDEVRIPALRALRHLMQNSRNARPRPDVVALFQQYELKNKVVDILDVPSVTTRQEAIRLHELLRYERVRSEVVSPRVTVEHL